MDSAAESADTVQNEANQMEKVDAEDAISANVEEIPTNSEALGVVETPEGNVKICPEIIVQDKALVFDDEAVLEENLGSDTKDSIETISESVEGKDESSGKDNEPISSEYFLKVPEVTLEDGLVAKEKKAEEITEEVDATFEYNEDHSKKAEKMNTIEEVFQEDHEGNTGGNEVASEELDVDTESGNEKTPKDDNGEHEIRIIRSTDDLNAQVETLEEEILETPHILEIAEPIQEVSEDDRKDASNDKGEETSKPILDEEMSTGEISSDLDDTKETVNEMGTSKPILDEEISTGEISSDLDDTKETVNEMGLKDDTVDHDNTKDLVIDFNEVLGQVNEADLKVAEIEELKHIDDIISSAVKVDSLNLDSSQSDSNATLTSDKTEKSSGITLTTDINEKFADTEINEDIEDSLPVKLAAPVMISKVIEIKQLDEISDEESLQHVQASDVTSIEEEDLLESV
ncbi:protein starmaker-like [Diaphorina citri]|uniref:Protein starmaker-like n=1 Tax=Diaphorina citri TaxID=121845 RepID=A0A1S3DEU9_DIACI|nr:protein starmaker-like [Diaphorina citri]